MIGFLIYVATIVYVPVSLGYFTFFFVRKERFISPHGIDVNILLIITIVFASFVNKLFGFNASYSIFQLIPETALMILMFWVSKSLSRKSLIVLIYLALFEFLFVVIEYYLNINSFFSELAISYGDSELLYDTRPYGLSSNSSVIALKFFLFILILFRYKLFSNIKQSLFILLFLIGVVLTFNRTIISSLLVFFFLFLIRGMKREQRIRIILLAVITLVSIILLLNFDLVILQITRGREGIDILSGRALIWGEFISFIKQNYIFGNNSYKYYIDYFGNIAHAHNSYLQILATHGIFIFTLFIYFIFRNINKANYIYVIPILIYSFAQYGVFWGFSITDIILYLFLFNMRIDVELKQNTYIKINENNLCYNDIV